jgi:ElaB/YqjD/DUF883 family membrane-anchored ribosome-binding protein
MDKIESSEGSAEKAGRHATEAAKEVKSAVENLEKQLEGHIRNDPIKSILIAVGVGLLFALLL